MQNPVIRAPRPADLAAPVGTLMRPTPVAERGDSLARTAQALRESGGVLLPVVDESARLIGVVTNAGLARALGEASEPTDAVEGFLEPATTLAPYAAAAEALRRGEDGRTMVVVDDAGRVVGVIAAVDLWPRLRALARPGLVGGMATPFGVYLTNGTVSAGASWWALMATGACMMGLFTAADVAMTQAVAHGLPEAVGVPLTAVLFGLLIRLSPLSGVHGAEHMVVNAIEREETLTPAVVGRMSRVHPRCGTNLATGLSLFMAILFFGQGDAIKADDLELRLLPAAVLAFTLARPLGSVIQRFVVTKPPAESQLRDAVRAGESLLERHATARFAASTPIRRIWCMGLIQVVAGATVLALLLAGVRALTGWAWLPRLN